MQPLRAPAPTFVHVYASRRRITRRVAVTLATTVAVVLLGLLLAVLSFGGRELPWAGAGASAGGVTSGQQDGDPGALGSQDGYLAVGASVSPSSHEPVVAKLDPALCDALRQAATDARADGIALRVNSGWRSARYQWALLRRAVATYGTVEVARQYVKPPAESSHVTGKAVDIGPTDADSWLSQHGSEYGLCQIYANERWHFERATAPGGTCPAMASDAAGG